MRFNVILTGGPKSGKTTTLRALKEKFSKLPSYYFIDEIVTLHVQAEKAKNPDVNPFADLVKLNQAILPLQIQEEDKAPSIDGMCTILDRSLIDDYAIVSQLKIGEKEHIDIASELDVAIKTRKYNLVFILERLPFETENNSSEEKPSESTLRKETNDAQAQDQHDHLVKTYNKYSTILGYNIIHVPLLPVAMRAEYIHNEIKKFMAMSLQSQTSVSHARAALFTLPTDNVALETTAAATGKVMNF